MSFVRPKYTFLFCELLESFSNNLADTLEALELVVSLGLLLFLIADFEALCVRVSLTLSVVLLSLVVLELEVDIAVDEFFVVGQHFGLFGICHLKIIQTQLKGL